jgi:broad specificity phosphatase PhoE
MAMSSQAIIGEGEGDPAAGDATGTAARAARVILIRHGRPDLPIAPRTSHREFRDYIDAYEEAGLDPQDAPPEELQDLMAEIGTVFTSDRKRAHESAKAVAPNAELVVDPLFVEAPLASPRIPILRMKVSKWAVVARVLWHAGYHPAMENYRKVKHRAAEAAEILIRRARHDGAVALIAHGYFNFLIGRELRRRGFRKSGTHRAKFWNAVVYEKAR